MRWQLDADGDVDTAPASTPYGAIVFGAGRTVVAVHPNASVLWRVKTKRKVYSSPAVAPDGTVFFGSQDHRLYAVAPDGQIRFAVDLGADVDCAPAVDDDGTVYAGADGGLIAAIDPSSGAIRWRKTLDGHVRGSLTITRSHQVVAGVYGPSPSVVELDGVSGAQHWRFRIQGAGAAEFGVHGSPVEDAQGNLFFGGQDDAVYALTADGIVRWKLGTGGDVDAPIVIASPGVLYVASDDGKLYAIQERALRTTP